MSKQIDILKKNLMILASAGSGKTHQLGNRVIGLVGVQDQEPDRVVALTFTRKAAGEFADSVLSKLAKAATEPDNAAELVKQIGHPVDAGATLERVIAALPRLQFGTMDGFFSRIVRGFQYELGLSGGSFELVQGPKLEGLRNDILAGLLGGVLDDETGREFLHAFRRATMGREENRITGPLAQFFEKWQSRWRAGDKVFGGSVAFGELPEVDEWERQKSVLARAIRTAFAGTEWTRKGQDAAVEKMIDLLEEHTVGSGKVDKAGKLFDGVREWVREGGPFVLKHYKEFTPDPKAGELLREALMLLARCELAAAVERTRAVGELVGCFDEQCERILRRRGMLGFDDVKMLLGAWERDEESRLRREAVDYRLDARFDHWLLDEFQDTSRAEWKGVVPLIDEAASGEERTLFVVGDEKQAIYGWRGGDVRLFGEVRDHYAGGMEVESMRESWRSCDAVLELVNRVCGAKEIIGRLHGDEVAARWPWEDHVSAKPKLTGESRVEVIGGTREDRDEKRRARLVELLKELGIGKRKLSCGVLVRTNSQVREVAELLRVEGFDVIEEGIRKPGEDNVVGVALLALLRWLADPADSMARLVVAMSPLEKVLDSAYGEVWQARWERLLEEVREDGFATVLGGLADRLLLSEFGRRRAGDVLGALAAFDEGGGTTAREAVRWVEGLEVAQSPGVAAVQVMTVHKSKGLGFDVVVLPEVEEDKVPNLGRFDAAEGEGWLLQPPAGWVRELIPELGEAEQRWSAEQRYEAMCLLYVALTRAKRGLYVLLSEPPKSWDESQNSAANWILQAVAAEGEGVAFQAGDPTWWQEVEMREESRVVEKCLLAKGAVRKGRATPSEGKGQGAVKVSGTATGRRFGNEVHAAFEQVGWADEGESDLPRTEGAERVRALLAMPEVAGRMARNGKAGDLFREQRVEAIVEGKWLSGVIDRMQVWKDEAGKVSRVEVMDFKTDAVDAAGELKERYAGQMQAYLRVVRGIYPEAEVEGWLLGVKAGEWVRV